MSFTSSSEGFDSRCSMSARTTSLSSNLERDSYGSPLRDSKNRIRIILKPPLKHPTIAFSVCAGRPSLSERPSVDIAAAKLGATSCGAKMRLPHFEE